MVNKYVIAGLGLIGVSEATFVLAGSTLALSALTIPAITITSGAITAAAGTAAIAGIGALVAAGAIAKAKLLKRNGKRSIEDQNCLMVDNPDLFLTLAANNDQLGCGMRLVCELEATSDDELGEEEALILNLFGRGPEPVKFQDLDKPKAGFQYAAYVGATTGECEKVFGTCPFNRSTMMTAFKEALNES
ncbi:unnamed protein product [Meganyctiphanes norvegica]|uniref:Uncharacterized protein n=1 Tax=Meganyctiphanes norvegica TaxID=48144 RepID=A0AAV2QH79_MEGNR